MRGIAALTALLLVGCFRANTTYCPATGAECPDGLACAPAPVYCGSASEVGACMGVSDRSPCMGEPGICLTGVCTPCTPDLLGCQYPGWVAMDSGTSEALKAVWVEARGNVYAVGAARTVLHYDGNQWSPASAPNIATDQELVGVGGQTGNLIVATSSALYMLDQSWAPLNGVPSILVSRVWTSPTSGTFVTAYSASMGSGYLGHFDGAWTGFPDGTSSFTGVWASSAQDVYVTSAGSALHFNGAAWASQSASSDILKGAWGSSATDVYVVGTDQNSMLPVISHSNGGGTWTDVTLPSGHGLEAIWGSADDNAYAIGDSATVLHWDGSSWTPAPDLPTGAAHDLNAIDGSGPDDIYVVGDGGVIWHYTGQP